MGKEKRVHTYFGMIVAAMAGLTLVLVAGLSLFSWKASLEAFQGVEKRLIAQNEKNCFDQIGNYLETDQYYVTELINSKAMTGFVEAGSGSEILQKLRARDLQREIQEMILLSQSVKESSIGFIRVYMKDGRSTGSDDEAETSFSCYRDCDDAARKCFSGYQDGYIPFLWVTAETVSVRGVPTKCLIGMNFLYEAVTLQRIGVVLIGIPVQGIRDQIDGLSETGCIIRIDGKILLSTEKGEEGQVYPDTGELIALGRQTSSGKLRFEGRNYRVKRFPGGVLWFLLDSDSVLPDVVSYRKQYLGRVIAMGSVSVLVTLLFALYISGKITTSIKELSRAAKRIEAGDFSTRFHSEKKDEVAVLGQSFNRMLDKISEFYGKEEENAAARSDLELKLLRAQINPHLLYNTLNSIVWIIRQGDSQKAEALVLSLGSFFKLALSKGNDSIALSEEVSMIRHYLNIQNLGRGKFFRLITQIPEELEQVRIMKLTLQPLVENAVVHGFTDWRDDGTVTIRAEADPQQELLVITVEDNGIGIMPEDIRRLEEEFACFPPKQEHKHFGLYSVHVRIRNRFGSGYGVSIESEVGAYTRMTVKLPLGKQADTGSGPEEPGKESK